MLIKKIVCLNSRSRRVSVVYGVSEDLDNLRSISDNLEVIYDMYVQKVLAQIPKTSRVRNLAMTVVPQLGTAFYQVTWLSFPRRS